MTSVIRVVPLVSSKVELDQQHLLSTILQTLDKLRNCQPSLETGPATVHCRSMGMSQTRLTTSTGEYFPYHFEKLTDLISVNISSSHVIARS
jgi:hypothetical protein